MRDCRRRRTVLHGVMLDRRQHRNDAAQWTHRGRKGVVATGHYLAAQVGAEVLDDGGNAVDAAIAASFALGVCEPAASGIGGMAHCVVSLGGSPLCVEGPCRAPSGVDAATLASSSRYRGRGAAAVPTHVSVMEHLHARWATKPLPELLAGAIGIARGGYPVTPLQSELQLRYRDALREHGAGELHLEDGEPSEIGRVVVQSDLARTLERLAEVGLRDFYEGDIARAIAEDMRDGGFVALADLQNLPSPRESQPLTCRLGGQTVYTLGPPGGGASLIQLLNMLSHAGLDLDRADDVAKLACLIRRVRSDRRVWARKMTTHDLGEAQHLVTAEYAAEATQAALVDPSDGETTHVCVVDAKGDAVSLTQSIERSYGSAVLAGSMGFLYNGFLRAFHVKPKWSNHPHFLEPNNVARSNAAPTIVRDQDAVTMVVGATGSERSTSTIANVLARWHGGADPFDAIAAPRLHCTPEGNVLLELPRWPKGTRSALEGMGLTVQELEAWDFKMGGCQCIARVDDGYCGVGEPRRDGAAAGPS